MNPLSIRFFMMLVLAVAALSATAGPLADADAQKVQAVISAQLEAFAADDADRAFDTATPQVRQAIGSSDRFLTMVRGAYPMVYRSESITFHQAEEDEGTVLQLVEIKDRQSKSWLALFALEQQPDATWRISGCIVAENPWRSI
jgi:hypothetical protein